ncbi:hypothetical protein MsAc7_12600 [Methanolapillus millepedarum]|uniref:Uncharacterized protein n=1 Tax=Methanolapillus millepedarum TaxID=3028296 RepID=A0AA96ZW93_9EURY|nr:hypothetical protein MsAc7_12600 [Methanosarcinaceae archaeon Ac7]
MTHRKAVYPLKTNRRQSIVIFILCSRWGNSHHSPFVLIWMALFMITACKEQKEILLWN